MKKFLLLSALLMSCAHDPKSMSDIQINESYNFLGSQKAEYQSCKITARNVMTMVPTGKGRPALPLSLVGGPEGLVCGEVQCENKKDNSDWYCGPIDLLMAPAQSSKSE